MEESNSDLHRILKHRYSAEDIRKVLEDTQVKEKLTRGMDFYSGADAPGSYKWSNGAPLSEPLKEFVRGAAKRLKLQEDKVTGLLEQFMTQHPEILQQVASSDSPGPILNSITRVFSQFYYKERSYLLKSIGAVISIASTEGHGSQAACLEFFNRELKTIGTTLWNQFKATGKREVPDAMYSPFERQEWLLQLLREEKEILKVLICLQSSLVHCSAGNLEDYCKLFLLQKFSGSYQHIIEAEQPMSDYKELQLDLRQQIGDLCVFLLLSSVRLESMPVAVNWTRNPFSLISTAEDYRKIKRFIDDLRGNPEAFDEHFGVLVVSWMCLLMTVAEHTDGREYLREGIGDIVPLLPRTNFFRLVHELTTRKPFTGRSVELVSVLKMNLLTFLARVQLFDGLEKSRDFHLLVSAAEVCLAGEDAALWHFWHQDFPNKTGLYLMFKSLCKWFPYNAEPFLHFAAVLAGGDTHTYAADLVQCLDSLCYYCCVVDTAAVVNDEEDRVRSRYQINNEALVFREGCLATVLEVPSHERLVVSWEVEYSLWPVFLTFWQKLLDELRFGNNPLGLETLQLYLQLFDAILAQDVSLGVEIEHLSSRNFANDFAHAERSSGAPFELLTSRLLESYLELSKIPAPPLAALNAALQALASIYGVVPSLVANHICDLIKEHSATHPIFAAASKLRFIEDRQKDHSVSLALLAFCNAIVFHEGCVELFQGSFLRELVRYTLSDILLYNFKWLRNYRWTGAALVLQLLETLVRGYLWPLRGNSIFEALNSQIPKVELGDYLQHCLQVVIIGPEGLDFENVHWHLSRNDNADMSEIECIRTMILRALRVLEVLTARLQSADAFFAKNIKVAIERTAITDDCLPLVVGLMSYVNSEFKHPSGDADALGGEAALRCLSNIVIYWRSCSQRNQLELYFSGNSLAIKKKFVENCLNCLCDNTIGLSDQVFKKMSAAMLEFLVLALPQQNHFCDAIITPRSVTDVIQTLGKFRDLSSEEADSVTLNLFYHMLELLNEILVQKKIYPTAAAAIQQDMSFGSVVLDALGSMLAVRDMNSSRFCLSLHSFGLFFSILASRPSVIDTAVVQMFIDQSSKSLQTGLTGLKMNNCLHSLYAQGIEFDIKQFYLTQALPQYHWRVFDVNPNAYGNNYYIETRLVHLFLQVHKADTLTHEETIEAVKSMNVERSSLDAQEFAFKKFCTYIYNLLQHEEKQTPDLLINLLTCAIEKIWIETDKERAFNDEIVIRNISNRFEALTIMVRSLLIFMDKKPKEKYAELLRRFFEEFKVLMNGLPDLLKNVSKLTEEILSFIVMATSFHLKYSQYAGIELDQFQGYYALVPEISKHLTIDSALFKLTVSALACALNMVFPSDQMSCLQNLPTTRFIFDKLILNSSTHSEIITALKFFNTLAQGVRSAKVLMLEGLVSHVAQIPLLKHLSALYENGERSQVHIIWCWVLVLVENLQSVLLEENKLITQIITLLSEFSGRIEMLLQFNFEPVNKYGGTISQNKQFSLAYLEELLLVLNILSKLVQCTQFWRSPKKATVENWISLLVKHTLRITEQPNLVIVFPSVSETEHRLKSNFKSLMIRETGPSSFFDTPSIAREREQLSVYSFMVESAVILCSSTMTNLLVEHREASRSTLRLELEPLIQIAKFCFETVKKIDDNREAYDQIEKTVEEEMEKFTTINDNSSLKHYFFSKVDDLKESIKLCFEYTCFLLIRNDVNSNPDAKANFNRVLDSWIKKYEYEAGQIKDEFLKWIHDSLRSN